MTLTPCPPLSSPPSSPLLPRLSFVCQSIPMHSKSDQVFYYSVFHPLIFFSSSSSLPSLRGWTGGGGLVFSHRFCQSRPGRRLPGWHVASGLQWLETSRSLSPSWSSLLHFLFLCVFFFIFLFTPLSFFSASSSSPPLPCPFHPSPILPHTPLNPPHLHPSFGFLILFLLRFLFFFFVIPHPSRPCFLHPFVYLLCLSGSF